MHKEEFSMERQHAFAKLSGDFNKLHVDPVAARRYLFGGAVVHGIHLLLWALDRWLAEAARPVQLVSLRASFARPLLVGGRLEYSLVSESDEDVGLKLYDADQVFVVLKFRWRPAESIAKETSVNWGIAADMSCKDLKAEEIENASGEVGLYVGVRMARALFPNLVRHLPLGQIAQITATSRLVGMECPGRNSVFS